METEMNAVVSDEEILCVLGKHPQLRLPVASLLSAVEGYGRGSETR